MLDINSLTDKSYNGTVNEHNVLLFQLNGGNINQCANGGSYPNYTPFTAACGSGKVNSISVLINAGCDLTIKDNNNYNGMFISCNNNKYDAVELLIKSGIDMNIRNPSGKTGLMQASNNNYPDIVALLLSYGVDLNIKDNDNKTALDRNPNSHIKKMLQNENIFINKASNGSLTEEDFKTNIQYLNTISNADGFTPLMRACRNGHLSTASLLLSFNADTTIKNKQGKTALDLTTKEEIKQLLVEPQILLKSSNGSLTDDDIVEHLATYDGNDSLNVKSLRDGYTSLMKACNNGHTSAVSLLIKHGSDITIKNRIGQTAFALASNDEIKKIFSPLLFILEAEKNNLGVNSIKNYMDNNGDLNSQSPVDGFNAFMKVCQNGNFNIAKRLIVLKADIHLRNHKGQTALDLTSDEDIRKTLIDIDEKVFFRVKKFKEAIDKVIEKRIDDSDAQKFYRKIKYGQTIEDSIICNVCKCPLIPPLEMHLLCGNVFCQYCHINHTKCSNSKCNKTLEKKDIVHTIPMFMVDRLNKIPMICPNCQQHINRENLLDHISSECKLYCPYGCCTLISLNEFKEHETVCVAYPASCPAEEFQCTWKDRKGKLAEHVKICPFLKVMPVLQHTRLQIQSLQQQIELLRQTLDKNKEFK